jgi:quercetin dioxygenase-like cupin family protein
MKTKPLPIAVILALSCCITYAAEESQNSSAKPLFAKLADAKWERILPDLGADSPQICVLHVDPETQTTQLLICSPKAIHIRKLWHTGNETHTLIEGTATFACEGQKIELGSGGFNYMPAKMVHEAWLSEDH